MKHEHELIELSNRVQVWVQIRNHIRNQVKDRVWNRVTDRLRNEPNTDIWDEILGKVEELLLYEART